MTSPAIAVVGMGCVTAFGEGVEATWQALLRGERAVMPWDDLRDEGFPLVAACRVDDAVGLPAGRGRGRALAVRAAAEALDGAGALTTDGHAFGAATGRVGCYIGTTMGESAEYEAAHTRGAIDLDAATGRTFTGAIAERFGWAGPQRVYGTACAAGNYAIHAAARDLAAGRIDVAVAGGVEPFSRIAMLGFARMRAMSRTGCEPFGRGRAGMTLGEGAGLMVLRRLDDARADGQPALAVVGGAGFSADAHHPTSPRADGRGMALAMRRALAATGLDARDVGWVCAHGTGTVLSDSAEARALHAAFGDPPPTSSLKGATGHAMGAAAAIEAVMAVRALAVHVIPPNVGMAEQDPDIELDIVRVPRPDRDLRWVMNCAYAFGGLNSALMIGRAA